jgi:DNA ligase (NAD+)
MQNRIKELEKLLIQYKHEYYCIGEPSVSDFEYDALERELRRLDASNYVLEMVGCPCTSEST